MPAPGARLEWKEEIGYTGFGCSHCAWTDPNPSFERGRPAIAEPLSPDQAPPRVRQEFDQHSCAQYPKAHT
jgi:hypothetical protein